jgi:hypothetical protein
MSPAAAIDYFAKEYTLRRSAAGSYVSGRHVDGEHTDTAIMAAVFAPSSQDVFELAEGQRTNVVWTIWTRSELRAVDEDTQTEADMILVNGDWFQVFKLWPRTEGDYFKALLERDVARGRSVHSTAPVVSGGDWH